MNVIFGDWQIAPLVRWQSGNRLTVTTGVDNALTGQGGQRAVQILDDVYGDGTREQLSEPRCLHVAGSRHLQHAEAQCVHRPSQFQNDLALTRTFGPAEHRFQFRWEIFNVINKVNFNNPTSALNSANFGRILTAGEPRIMQFAFKYDF